MDQMGFNQRVGVAVEHASGLKDPYEGLHQGMKFLGMVHVEHERDGKIIAEFDCPNMVTNEGKDSNLNVYFHSASQITTWYIGLIDVSGYIGVLIGDTLAGYASWAWNEYSNYTGNRQAWSMGASSGQSVTNSSPSVFPILGTASLKGIFICNAATAHTGVLWSTALFPANVAVVNGDSLKITYTVNVG